MHQRRLVEYQYYITRGNKHLALSELRRAVQALEGEIANDEQEARQRAARRARNNAEIRSIAYIPEDSPPAEYRAVGGR